MVRSFHHAALAPLVGDNLPRGRTPGMIRPEDIGLLQQWAEVWFPWVAAVYIQAYQEHLGGANLVPASANEFETLLADFLLERALRELASELEVRPQWAAISLRAIVQLVGQPAL
jgi:maltose alpha-D-glucosyltransferase/alpha-amylase